MAKATDIIPDHEEFSRRISALPEWARQRASQLAYPDCPPPGVLYVLPSGVKVYLVLTIAEALVEATKDMAEALESLAGQPHGGVENEAATTAQNALDAFHRATR
jgi:hypothetical protein